MDVKLIRGICGVISVLSVTLLIIAGVFWKVLENSRAGEFLGFIGALFLPVGGIPLVLSFAIKEKEHRD